MAEYAGHTAKNGAIGAGLTLIMSTVPLLGFVSPLFGGFTSGYLEERGAFGGARAGIAMALLSGIPVLVLGGLTIVLGPISIVSETIFGSILGTLSAAPSLVVIGLWFVWTIFALLFGLIGGIIGGTVAS